MKPPCARGPLLAAALFFGSVALSSVLAQGTFRNLDFESATVPPLPTGQYGTPDGVLAADAIPYWTAYYGSSLTPTMTYNNYTLGTASISLLGPYWNNPTGIIPILGGSYSMLLQTGDRPGPVTASIAQIGTIPADAQSIQLRLNGGGLGVGFAGHNIPLVILDASNPLNLLVGGDISAFAGQTGELQLTALNNQSLFNSPEIDDIVFSTNPIPEPGIITLLIFGAALFGLTAWRRRA